MKRFLLMLAVLSGAAQAQITTSTTLGRLLLVHPDLGHIGGATLHTKMTTLFTRVADNVSTRYQEYTAVANSTLSTYDHEFGVPFADLTVILWSGNGTSKTRISDPAGAGWTIAATVGFTTTKIDITTPSSGGPHTFAIEIYDGLKGMAVQSPGAVAITGGTVAGVTLSTTTVSGALQYKESGGGSDTISIAAPVLAAPYSLTLPVDDGTADQLLATDGNGVLSWVSSIATPIITNATLRGTTLLQNTSGAQPILAWSEDPDNGTDVVNVQAPASLAASYTLTWPVDDGTSGQVLSTDGSGVLSWAGAATVPAAGVVYSTGAALASNTVTQGGLIYGSASNVVSSTSAGTASQWTLSGGTGAPTFSNTTTTGKVIDGSADQNQLRVQANATQTSDTFVVEDSAGTDQFKVAGSGTSYFGETSGDAAIKPNAFPSYTFLGDEDTGMAVNGPNVLALATNNTIRFEISATGVARIAGLTTNGPVFTSGGVGTLNSEQFLDRTRGGTGITSTATFPSSGVVVTEAATETLTNKTFQADDGTAGAPTLSFDADTNTGGYRVGTDDMAFATAGVARLEIDATGNTAVWKGGLPTTTVTVQDQLFVNNKTGGSNTGGIAIGKFEGVGASTDINENLGRLSFSGTANDAYVVGAQIRANPPDNWGSGSAPTDIQFLTVPTSSTTLNERMRITSTGNVGINATPPVGNDGSSRTFQIGGQLVITNLANNQAAFTNNAYYDGGANWKYVVGSTPAAAVRMDNAGRITFHSSGSGGGAGSSIGSFDTSDVKMDITVSTGVKIFDTGGIGTNIPHGCTYRKSATGATNPATITCTGNEKVFGGGCFQTSAQILQIAGAASGVENAFTCQWAVAPTNAFAHAQCCYY